MSFSDMTLIVIILVLIYLVALLSAIAESNEKYRIKRDLANAKLRKELALMDTKREERRLLAELRAPKHYHMHQHIHSTNIDKAVILKGEDHGRKNCGRTSLHSD